MLRPNAARISGSEPLGGLASGIEVLEAKLTKVYALHGKPENFHSVIYHNTGHQYLPEMKEQMIDWFEKYLR